MSDHEDIETLLQKSKPMQLHATQRNDVIAKALQDADKHKTISITWRLGLANLACAAACIFALITLSPNTEPTKPNTPTALQQQGDETGFLLTKLHHSAEQKTPAFALRPY